VTEHDVEGVIRERQRRGVGLTPFDRGTARSRERSGNGKHARIEIGRNNRPAFAHLLGRDARHHARPTRNIEHAVSRPEIGEVDDDLRPRAEYGWDQLTLIHLRRATGHLPLAAINRLPEAAAFIGRIPQ
jgi:hypothetical protein